MRPPILAVLVLAAVCTAEEWDKLGADWRAALDRYAHATRLARSERELAKFRHPWRDFEKRVRGFAHRHANTPAAAPALVLLARYTADVEKRHQLLLRLRENHLRSKAFGELIPDLARWGDADALRTLRDLVSGTRHPDVRRRAQVGLYEATRLCVGKPAPGILGETPDGKSVALTDLVGRTVVVFAAPDASKAKERIRRLRILQRRFKDKPFTVVASAAVDEPGWIEIRGGETTARRWNAIDGARLYVLDGKGLIRAKDSMELDLAREIEALLR